MFDIGFSELAVIGLVALIVIGPEKLPQVSRTVGHLLGRFRRYVSDVKSDIHREMEAADFKRLQEDVEDAARSIHSTVNGEFGQVQSALLNTDTVTPSTPDLPVPFPTATAEAPAALPEPPELVQTPPVDENQLDLFGQPQTKLGP